MNPEIMISDTIYKLHYIWGSGTYGAWSLEDPTQLYCFETSKLLVLQHILSTNMLLLLLRRLRSCSDNTYYFGTKSEVIRRVTSCSDSKNLVQPECLSSETWMTYQELFHLGVFQSAKGHTVFSPPLWQWLLSPGVQCGKWQRFPRGGDWLAIQETEYLQIH